jgi:transcriptional regulator with XRE-family HTH domain
MTCQVMVGRQDRRYGRSVTTTMHGTVRPVGALLRDWRQRRRLSQLELASQAEVSARHLSFVENGRARPSREMVLHLCEQLDVPLRERNALLVAAGFAPVYRQTDLDAPEMDSVRLAIDQVLKGHEPYPAVVVDRRWNLVAGNDAVAIFVNGVDPGLLEPPMNVLHLTMHPRGLATRIANFAEYRHHLLTRLRRETMITGDEGLAALHEELMAYPAPEDDVEFDAAPPVVMPLRLHTDDGDFSFFSTIATFGTAVDITLEELSIEAFFPADEPTARYLRSTLRTP